MAIAFVAAGTGAEAASGNISPTMPGTVNPDDIAIIVWGSDDNVTASLPGGWAIADQTNSNFTHGGWGWKRCDGTEDGASVTITHPAGGGIAGRIYLFSGVIKTGNPYSTKSQQANTTSSSTITASTITPNAGDTVLLMGAIGDISTLSGYSGTDPTFTELGEFSGTGSNFTSHGVSSGTSSGAATGSRTITSTGSGPSVGWLVALMPHDPWVVSHTNPADWNETGTSTRSVSGISWQTDDLIVAAGTAFNSTITLTTPTNANLTFSTITSLTDGGAGECPLWIWSAKATSTQSSQTISTTISDSTRAGQMCIWVIRRAGDPHDSQTSRTEATLSSTTVIGDVLLFFLTDFQANAAGRTGVAGSGTLTERTDTQASGSYYVWAGDWANTGSGSFSFGLTDYTLLKVGQGLFEVSAPPISVPPPQLWIVRVP
jgi:hypothetical protein